MNKSKVISVALLAACWAGMTACSTLPRVSAEPTISLPSRAADSIAVYEPGQDVPQGTQEIGKVRVMEGGITLTTKCLYANMLSLAVKKTAECGGNGLRIDEHKQPSQLGSSCHRIRGTMLLLPDSVEKRDAVMTLQDIEAKYDEELLAISKLQLEKTERMVNTPKNIIKVNAGVSWLNSKFMVGNYVYKSRSAFDYSIAYEHLWKMFGVGINFEQAKFSFDRGYKFGVTCIGPDFIFTFMLGKQFRFECLFGVEYTSYKEELYSLSHTDGNVSTRLGASLEYKFAKHLALGIQLDAASLTLDKPDNVVLEDDERWGIDRGNILAGLRYYF